jgi:azurin
MKILRVLCAAACGLAFVVSGCGRKEPATDRAASSAAARQPAAAPAPESGRAIEITGNDAMKFSVTEIRAKPGEALSVTLINIGTMPKFSMGHNWVLLKDAAQVDAFVNESATAPTTDYIPPGRKGDIYAATKLLGPKEKDTVTFYAPGQPGRYIFLCSFPGHYQVGMKGELIIE